MACAKSSGPAITCLLIVAAWLYWRGYRRCRNGSISLSAHDLPTVGASVAFRERIGWDTIVGRAYAAVRELPASTVLGGFSMGVGVIGSLWPDRPAAAGVFLLHATTTVPEGIPIGTPVQAHVADDDRFTPPDQLAAFRTSAAQAGAETTLHTYPSAGHFYTDPSLPDHNPVAAARTWQRIDALPGVASRFRI